MDVVDRGRLSVARAMKSDIRKKNEYGVVVKYGLL